MILARLAIRNLRNLIELDIKPAARLNLIIGENASGKTSMLEAIYLVGMARTFRNPKGPRLISHGKDELTVFGHLVGAVEHRLGIRKSEEAQNLIQLDGKNIKRSAELAALFPLQLITPDSFRLLTDGPSRRRAFIDWSLFHVEHQFHDSWQRYRKLLKQRNTVLKSGQAGMLRHWDAGLIEAGLTIDRLRKEFVEQYREIVMPYLETLINGVQLSFEYRQGWRREMTLGQALEHSEQRDLKQGFTSVGPHRADLEIKCDGTAATDLLSRGQMKLLICAMKLAQIAYLKEKTGKVCVVLVDDLPAELDQKNRQRLIALLQDLDTQLFITATDRGLIDISGWPDSKVFHVKHDQAEEVV